jgi:hypothetical protein
MHARKKQFIAVPFLLPLIIATQVDPTKQHNHIHIKHENQSLS